MLIELCFTVSVIVCGYFYKINCVPLQYNIFSQNYILVYFLMYIIQSLSPGVKQTMTFTLCAQTLYLQAHPNSSIIDIFHRIYLYLINYNKYQYLRRFIKFIQSRIRKTLKCTLVCTTYTLTKLLQ